MRSGDQHNPEDFPDLSLPERPGEVPPPLQPSSPHIKIQAKDETIQTVAELEEAPLRSILLAAGSSLPGKRPFVPRVIAGVLAFLGSLWGLYLLPDMLTGGLVELVTLGPFYLLTAGYFLRALNHLTPGMRRLLWRLSILVHGAWLAFAIWLAATGPITTEARFAIAWWAVSLGLSIWALGRETPDAIENSPATSHAHEERIVMGMLILLIVIAAVIAVVFYVVRLR